MEQKKPKVQVDPSSHRAELQRQNAQKMVERKTYLEDKRRLLKDEETNYDKLYVLRTHDGWWKMFGHSALIYKHVVCKDMFKTDVKLLPDTDYYVTSSEGYVSITSIHELEKRLKRRKIYALTAKPRGWIFELGFKVTEQDLNLMRNEEEMQIERANALIATYSNLAPMNQKVKEVVRELYSQMRLMDGVARDAFGNEMIAEAIKLKMMTVRTQRGTMSEEEYFKQAYSIAEDLYGHMSNIIDLRLLSSKKIFTLTQAIVQLEKQIDREVRKRAINAAKENMRKETIKVAEEKNDEKGEPGTELSKEGA